MEESFSQQPPLVKCLRGLICYSLLLGCPAIHVHIVLCRATWTIIAATIQRGLYQNLHWAANDRVLG